MKIRTDFVTNSSSSSFLIAVDKVPKSRKEAEQQVFDGNFPEKYENDDLYSKVEVLESIVERVEKMESLAESKDSLDNFYNMYFPINPSEEQVLEFVEKDGFYIDKMSPAISFVSHYDKTNLYHNIKEKLWLRVYDEFLSERSKYKELKENIDFLRFINDILLSDDLENDFGFMNQISRISEIASWFSRAMRKNKSFLMLEYGNDSYSQTCELLRNSDIFDKTYHTYFING